VLEVMEVIEVGEVKISHRCSEEDCLRNHQALKGPFPSEWRYIVKCFSELFRVLSLSEGYVNCLCTQVPCYLLLYLYPLFYPCLCTQVPCYLLLFLYPLFYPCLCTQVPCYLLLFLYPLFYPCLYPTTRYRGRPPRAPWFCREWRVPLNRKLSNLQN